VFTDSKGEPGGAWKVPYIDSAGRLWVASEQGLARSDNPTETTPRFVTYSTAQGLSSNDVKAITEDLSGNIYVATGRGVDRIRPTPQGIMVTRHYTNADGLAAGELASAYRDRSGTLWFVTTLGISRLTPVPDRPPVAPPVLVTGLQIGTAARSVADVGQAEIQGLRIHPGQGPLRIDFVGLSFAPGETLRYQYQLSVVDREWSAPTDQRTVVYGRLAAGKYHFQVRAVNSEGMVSSVPASVAFTMLPPVWQTWWFILSAAVSTVGLGYAAHRYRVRQLLAVERVRMRIATDLHDDIGASLSQISILSDLVRQRLNTSDPHVARPLAEIALVSSEVVASLSDIVWAINPRHDRLSDLAARMRRFAFDVLGARGIEVHFQADGQHVRMRTNSDFRRQVYLIFKEAVNNSVRHACCTRADVDLQVGHGRLQFRLSDNGAGFDPSSQGNGNGLANMRRRAADLGGHLAVRSELGRGTDLTVNVPLPHSRTS
jgi:signal transduction histidine kinase